MTGLPNGWNQVRLDDLKADEPRSITDGPFGSNLTSSHYTPDGARVVRLQNIGDGAFNDAHAFISMAHFEDLRRHEVLPGDLLIASLGEDLPRACLAPPWLGPAIVKADCIRVRLGDLADRRWVMYAMQTPAVRHWAGEQLHGVGRPRLGLKVIREIPVPLPPVSEQRRIIEILEEHLSHLDAAVSSLNRGLRGLTALKRAALIQSIATASDIADTIYAEIGSIAKVGSGATPLKSKRIYYEGGDIPWVTSGDLATGQVDYVSHFITSTALAETAVKLYEPGTLLVAMYGEGKTRGTVAELKIRATTNQACAAICLASEFDAYRPWVKLFLQANYETMRKQASGGVQPNLSLGRIKSMLVPLPPARDVGRLIRIADDWASACDQAERELRIGLARSASLRRSLLSSAFSGRLTGRSADTDVIEELASA